MTVLLRLTGLRLAAQGHLAGAMYTMSAATVAVMFIPMMLGTATGQALESGLRSRLLLDGGILAVSALHRAFS